MSSNYVAELLKQLEDLKRKKALKERKLMKIKALKSIKKDKSLENPVSSSNRKILDSSTESKPDFKDDNASSCNSVNKDLLQSNCSIENASVLPHSKHSESDCSEIDKENIAYKKPDLLLFEDYKLKNSIKASTDTEKVSDKVNEKLNFCTENTDNSGIETDRKIKQTLVNPKITPNAELLTTENKGISLVKTDETMGQKLDNFEIRPPTKPPAMKNTDFSPMKYGEVIEPNNVICEAVSTSAPVIKVDFVSDNFISDKCKLSDDSSKSLVLSNSRSKSPDLLDDSFDCNMSVLITAEEQVSKSINDPEVDFNDSDQIKIISNNVNEFVNNKELDKEIKVNSKAISSQLEISPPCSINPSFPESQLNQGIFNFPKFSTPSNINVSQCDFNKSKSDNLQDKCEIQMSPCKVTSGCNDDDGKFLKNDDLHTSKNFTQKDVQTDKFISSKLNCILGSGLSSVLDAHYGSPNKDADNKSASDFCQGNKHSYSADVTNECISKKRKLNLNDNADSVEILEHSDISSFASVSSNHVSIANKLTQSLPESNIQLKLGSTNLTNAEIQNMNEELDDFDNTLVFMTNSNPFTDSQTNSSDPQPGSKISSQVTETVDGLIMKVCETVSSYKFSSNFEKVIETRSGLSHNNDEINLPDSEILVIPETEGLGLYFAKDTEDFLETSTLSESCNHFQENNLLNTSSQSRLRTPVVNRIVSAIKSSNGVANTLKFKILDGNESEIEPISDENKKLNNASTNPVSAFNDSLGMDTSFLEDDTQDLGNLKQVPYMSEEKVQENAETDVSETKRDSNLSFTCSLYGKDKEPVIDAEIILFGDVKYAFLQQKTEVHVWRQEKNDKWIKIFCHQIEEMLSLNKMCISKDEENLVVVMLLSNDQQCCLQFLLFERDARVIKLMENTHWLEERHSMDFVLLCGLDGLMFATAQQKESHEVSLHAFIGLKENPRLMTAVLGSTERMLCSLCKIDKLPNALMGINDSMLYIWHILEARLVTAVSLHPHDYLPIKSCFWAIVENGLIYFLTTCEGSKEYQVCQLLAANLATGFCQSAMTYSTQPSGQGRMLKITKATYLEPYLVVAHSRGAILWSVTEEYCCAALSTKSKTTTIAVSKDTENWGLVAVGYGSGCINCYSLK